MLHLLPAEPGHGHMSPDLVCGASAQNQAAKLFRFFREDDGYNETFSAAKWYHMFHNCIKSQFYVEICKRFNKRNEMMNNNHFVLFYFSIYQI